MSTPMGPYLRNNLWRTFACGKDSYGLLTELYSFSAVEPEGNCQGLEDFLKAYLYELHPEDEKLRETSLQRLREWFETDWLSFEEADKILMTYPSLYHHLALEVMNPYRALFTLLIFHPHLITSRWVNRLWRDALASHEGDALAAEVELIFLCEESK